MNIQNNLQGLQQLLSSPDVSPAAGKAGTTHGPETKGTADQATLSSAASAASALAPDSDVRMEKVAAIQKALATDTYNVPASEVAGRMIDHMLGK